MPKQPARQPFFSRTRPLRVLTMNIWNYTEPYARRMALLRRGIEALDPDLLAFQEAGYRGRDHQVAQCLQGLDYHLLHQFEIRRHPGAPEGCCVASRWPVKLAELLPLNLTVRARRYPYAALAVQVAAPPPVGRALFVCAKPSWELNQEYERELQAVHLARLVAKHSDPDGFPPIVAGDFDATPESSSIRFLTGKQSLHGRSVHFRDAWAEAGDGSAGHTWTHASRYARIVIDRQIREIRHARRIDYILLGSPLVYKQTWARISRCRVVLNKPRAGVWPSDHYAVYAEIDVA